MDLDNPEESLLSYAPGAATYPAKIRPTEQMHSIDLARMPGEDNELLLPLYVQYSAHEVLYPMPGAPAHAPADIVSFGIMLFECAANGRFPSMCGPHPDLVHDLVPPELRTIVAKCVQREPIDRYWCTESLLFDLEHVLKLVRAKFDETVVPKRELGYLDRISRFALPEKLYGIDEHLKRIRQIWEECRSLDVLCITGPVGCGKTRLIQTFLQDMDGPSIYAKCDSGRTKPFEAIAALLDQWLAILLAQSDELCTKLTSQIPDAFIPLLKGIVREDIFRALRLDTRPGANLPPPADLANPVFVPGAPRQAQVAMLTVISLR
jgi:hypothetical protein